jgi:putative restriction endonuclease
MAEGSTPTKKWLKENVTYGHFDDDLWVLLQSRVWRQKLRDYIVEHKLTDDSWLGKIAAEGLGAIAALLLAA